VEIIVYILNLIIKIIGLFIFIFIGVMYGTKERRAYTRNIRILKKHVWFKEIVDKPSFIMVNNNLFRKLIAETNIESLLNDSNKIKSFKEKLLNLKEENTY
jgi:hypothetical protein